MSFPILVHTHYSVGQAFAHPDKLVAKALEYKLPAIALTDRHTLSGVPEFLETIQKAKAKGKIIKPVIGCQFRVFQKYWITLYAKNLNGWKNLIKILGRSVINEDGNPEVTLQDITANSKDLICCIGGVDSIHIHPEFSTYQETINKVFKNNIYYVVVNSKWECDHTINDALPNNMPAVVTTPVYYIEQDDQICQQILVCGRHQKTMSAREDIFVDEPSAKMFWDTDANYLHGTDHYPPVPFLDQIEEFVITGKPNIPKFSDNSPELLTQLCRKGWNTRKIKEKAGKDESLYQVYVDRIKTELSVFANPSLVLADYMLIIYDIMRYARECGSLAGLRGSASGCLVSYLTEISDVDPVIPDPTLPYHPGRSLLFERFFNKARLTSLADIDLDLCPSFRPQLKQYLVDKYGKDNVAPYIITYNRMDGRGAVREVMRVLESASADVLTQISTRMLDKAKIQDDLEDIRESKPNYTTIEFNIENIPDIASAAEEYPKEFQLAIRMSDTIVSAGKHAAAVVISAMPIRDTFPIVLTDDGETMIGVEMEYAEALGAVKYDLLCVAAYEKILRIFEMVNNNLLEPVVVDAKEDD